MTLLNRIRILNPILQNHGLTSRLYLLNFGTCQRDHGYRADEGATPRVQQGSAGIQAAADRHAGNRAARCANYPPDVEKLAACVLLHSNVRHSDWTLWLNAEGAQAAGLARVADQLGALDDQLPREATCP